MTQIGTNIKKLRSVKGLSQQAFGELFNLTRGNISSYEEFRAEPKVSVILQIAKYFSIPVAHLLEKKLTVNEILNFEDHFTEDSAQLAIKNMDPVHFLNRETIQQSSDNKISIDDLPAAFPFEENSILFFEKLQLDILHTLDKHFGFYIKGSDYFFGTYEVKNKQIDLLLNDWKKQSFSVEDMGCFWKLHGKYEKIA